MEKTRIVVDTNIVANAIRKGGNRNAKSRCLLRYIYYHKYEVYISSSIFDEYKRVLYGYPRINPSKIARMLWFLWIKKYAIFIEPRPTNQEHEEMKDEDDRIFFDVAKCVGAKLITRNYKDYPVHELITLIDEMYTD